MTEQERKDVPVTDERETEESAEFVLGENVGAITDEKAKKKAIRKKTLVYALFIVVNAAVILGMVLLEDRSGNRADGKIALALLGQNPLYVALAVGAFFLVVLFDAFMFRVLVKKIGGVTKPGACLKASLLGRYFDRVTPWAIGGEPFQIYYLKKSGLQAGQAAAVTMSRHAIRFFTTAIAVIALMSAYAAGLHINAYVLVAAIISVCIGLVIPSFMLLCAFRPALGNKIVVWVVGLLHKLKLVKDREKTENKFRRSVEEFLTGLRFLSANKSAIILIALGSLFELFAMTSVPFFVMKALGGTPDYMTIFVLCLFVNYAASFAPTPGGAGIAELSFYAVFGSVIEGGLLFWAVLFWRLCVFYFPVFVGFVTQTASTVTAIVRLKKNR